MEHYNWALNPVQSSYPSPILTTYPQWGCGWLWQGALISLLLGSEPLNWWHSSAKPGAAHDCLGMWLGSGLSTGSWLHASIQLWAANRPTHCLLFLCPRMSQYVLSTFSLDPCTNLAWSAQTHWSWGWLQLRDAGTCPHVASQTLKEFALWHICNTSWLKQWTSVAQEQHLNALSAIFPYNIIIRSFLMYSLHVLREKWLTFLGKVREN